MHFGIARLHLHEPDFIEISEEAFKKLTEAKRNFSVLLDIEEKFDILLENYIEYENELLSLTLRKSVRLDNSWPASVSEIYVVNRRLANLLTTGLLYIDQAKRDIEEIYGSESPTLLKFKESISSEASQTPGFRLMRELRHHTQHRGLPVYRILYPNKSLPPVNGSDTSNRRRIRWSINPSLNVEALQKDRRMDKQALAEFESMGKYVPITPLVRQYVEAIVRLHKAVRELTIGDSANWEQQMESAIAQGKQHFQEDIIGVSIAAKDESGNYIESEQIFDDLIKRHEFLISKNPCLPIISTQFVSGECIEDD